MSVPSFPFHSLLLKLPNKEMRFSFSLLKLPNKKREEYSKMIIFIYFRSLRLRLGVHKGMEWNDYKGMEMNGMECNVFK